jgi:hypothetical protein
VLAVVVEALRKVDEQILAAPPGWRGEELMDGLAAIVRKLEAKKLEVK